MRKSKQNLDSSGGSLNTLALKRTINKIKDAEIIFGTGSCKSSVAKRPKRKFLTQKLALALVDVAKEEGDLKWQQRYWNVWHCQEVMTSHDGRMYGYQCKNRCCTVCVSIRKADMINKYKPVIDNWTDIHFITLTIKTKKKRELKKWMEAMKKALSLILDRCRKRYNRGKGPKLIGVASLECNFNPVKKTYNPHYHILCATKEIATVFKTEWLELWNRKYKKNPDWSNMLATGKCQDIRKVNNTEKDIIETIKYGAKIMTDPTMKKGKNKKVKPVIYAAALHEIYKSMDDINLFTKFGFKLPMVAVTTNTGKLVTDFKRWKYNSKLRDWIEGETGQILTDYIPDWEIENIRDCSLNCVY